MDTKSVLYNIKNTTLPGVNIEWIQCDDCMKWYHWHCVGLTAADVKKDTHTCESCEMKIAKTEKSSNRRSSSCMGDYDDDEEVGGVGSPLATPLATPTFKCKPISPDNDKQEEHDEIDIDGDLSYQTESPLSTCLPAPESEQSTTLVSQYEEMVVESMDSENIVVIPSNNTSSITVNQQSSLVNTKTPVNIEILECHEEMMTEVDEEQEDRQRVAMVTSVNDNLKTE